MKPRAVSRHPPLASRASAATSDGPDCRATSSSTASDASGTQRPQATSASSNARGASHARRGSTIHATSRRAAASANFGHASRVIQKPRGWSAPISGGSATAPAAFAPSSAR
ncbi:hypothetical protein DP42_5759 [Burkholderia pseudomallei]|nr:hypothetical protein DP42_5759 [Burkholderia pseudomallei]